MKAGSEIKYFDPEQIRAIRHGTGPMLVLAGPGSGKTTVLTHRILYLKEELHVQEKEILVLTFTRAAASEMKERFIRISGSVKTDVTFGTFHSFFYRELGKRGALRKYEVCERETEVSLIENILKEIYGKDFFPGTVCEGICDRIGQMKNGMEVSDALALKVSPLLERSMRERNLIDYDDILLIMLNLLTDDPDMLKDLRKRYRYILVDEFQDLNRVQYEILKLLAGKEKNIFAVGDDDQSIYGFRGSDPVFMKLFLNDFRCAGQKSVRRITLNANHRSDMEIVKASGKLIRHNRKRFAKRLKSKKGRGLKPVCMTFENAGKEAAYIIERIRIIREAAEKNGLAEPSFAILARTRTALKEVTDFLPCGPEIHAEALTFHGSKGLEFDSVFIVGTSEGITPDLRTSGAEALEEERRAFYVAMTRAKKYLHIFNTKTVYSKQMDSSRFIREIHSLF